MKVHIPGEGDVDASDVDAVLGKLRAVGMGVETEDSGDNDAEIEKMAENIAAMSLEELMHIPVACNLAVIAAEYSAVRAAPTTCKEEEAAKVRALIRIARKAKVYVEKAMKAILMARGKKPPKEG